MKPALGIALGLLYALFCEALALGVAGAGHGWHSPLVVGLAGFALFPLGFRSMSTGRYAIAGLAFCLACDVALIFLTIAEGVGYVGKVLPAALLWSTLWLAGQATWLLAMRRRESAAA